MAQSESKLKASAVDGHVISTKVYDGAKLTLGRDEGTGHGALVNEGDALGIALGAPLNEVENPGPDNGAPLIVGLNEGMGDGMLLNDDDALGITLGAPLTDGERLGAKD
jgi:hypothetical protein